MVKAKCTNVVVIKMFDPRRKYMQERDDGLCPFCGTQVDHWPVCKGCNAEKIYADRSNEGYLGYDFIYFLILVPILIYFHTPILDFLDKILWEYSAIPYYGFLAFCVLGLCMNFYDLRNRKGFQGYGWKKRR